MDFSFDVDLYKRDVEIIKSYIICLREEGKNLFKAGFGER